MQADNRGLLPQFLDKAREKQRQKSLKQAAGAAASQPAAPARQSSEAVKRAPEQGARLPAAKRRLLDGRQDAAELADEYALLRKLKKGKLSEVRLDCARVCSLYVADLEVCESPSLSCI